ncbi:putative HVA22-like protein g [Diospyros lotus]|uniref:putative HVA22-like protein g n=1 Tax=Diospyros lotus TaxID=55363 RepID=UPI00224F5849|nr:putative HVA22-like protein g [Diospyros lotus]
MLGEFISRGLVMVLGYAYPALECFKALEGNRVETADLRFWCQYWIIIAILTVMERFVSWVPMYDEVKLAVIIYLWHPKTKGTGYIYETFLRPYVAKYEPGMDRNLQEVRARAWNVALYYWKNCTELGQSAFVDIMDYLAHGKVSRSSKKDKKK